MWMKFGSVRIVMPANRIRTVAVPTKKIEPVTRSGTDPSESRTISRTTLSPASSGATVLADVPSREDVGRAEARAMPLRLRHRLVGRARDSVAQLLSGQVAR